MNDHPLAPVVSSTRPSPDAACGSSWGCGGRGWRWDLEDSGSGRIAYCACAAGRELMQRDLSKLATGEENP